MHILEVIIDGFKSYATRTVVSGETFALRKKATIAEVKPRKFGRAQARDAVQRRCARAG